jgi:hypothetical protein
MAAVAAPAVAAAACMLVCTCEGASTNNTAAAAVHHSIPIAGKVSGMASHGTSQCPCERGTVCVCV